MTKSFEGMKKSFPCGKKTTQAQCGTKTTCNRLGTYSTYGIDTMYTGSYTTVNAGLEII